MVHRHFFASFNQLVDGDRIDDFSFIERDLRTIGVSGRRIALRKNRSAKEDKDESEKIVHETVLE